MVHPITKSIDSTTQVVHQQVWIPEGAWVEWGTGETFIGPQNITRTYQLHEFPLFVRAGAIIPMLTEDRPVLGSAQRDFNSILLTVHTGGQTGKVVSSLYEDDGFSNEFESGAFAKQSFTYVSADTKATITIGTSDGTFATKPSTRAYRIRLNGVLVPTTVTVNGVELKRVEFNGYEGRSDGVEEAQWAFDGNKLAVVLNIGKLSTDANHIVEFTFEQPIKPIPKFVGCLNRLSDVKAVLDGLYFKKVLIIIIVVLF